MAVRWMMVLALSLPACQNQADQQYRGWEITDSADQTQPASAVSGAVDPANWPSDNLPWTEFQGRDFPRGERNAAGVISFQDPFPSTIDSSQPVWQTEIGLGYSSPVTNGQVVIVQDRQEDQERVLAFQATYGTLLWSNENPTSFETQFPMYTNGPIPTAAIDHDSVYTIGAEGFVQCLDLTTGQRKWSMAANDLTAERPGGQVLTPPPFGAGASPILHDNSVLVTLPVHGRRHSLYRLDRESGQVQWSALNVRCGYATPVISRIHWIDWVFVLHDQGLSVLRWSDGYEVANLPFRGKVVDSENAVTPVIQGNQIFLSAYGMPGTLVEWCSSRWDENSADENDEQHWELRTVWQSPRSLDSQYTNILLWKNTLLGFSARSRRLHQIDWQTGQELARWTLPVGRGMLVRSGDQIMVLGDEAELVIAQLQLAEPSEELHVADLPVADLKVLQHTEKLLMPKTFCTPCVTRQGVILRDQQRLVCYGWQPPPTE